MPLAHSHISRHQFRETSQMKITVTLVTLKIKGKHKTAVRMVLNSAHGESLYLSDVSILAFGVINP
jgi:hypothetical protein